MMHIGLEIALDFDIWLEKELKITTIFIVEGTQGRFLLMKFAFIFRQFALGVVQSLVCLFLRLP